jgi:hypothetical protein
MKIWNIVKRIFLYIFGALDTKPDSASLRKVSAVWTMILVTIAHYKFANTTNIDSIIAIDYIFISVLLGLVTAENLLFFFGGKNKVEKLEKTTEIDV